MEKVFKYVFLLVMPITLTMTGCKKDNGDDGKGEGKLIINGHEQLITECCFAVLRSAYNIIHFQNKEVNFVNVFLKPDELVAKTYNEIDDDIVAAVVVSTNLSELYDTNVSEGIKDFQMTVSKSGKTYDISIVGKVGKEDSPDFYDYSMTYKGSVRVEKDK